ncbi:hypothetical protein Hanom_Chr15g01405341 [Helianthus anomalus]
MLMQQKYHLSRKKKKKGLGSNTKDPNCKDTCHSINLFTLLTIRSLCRIT